MHTKEGLENIVQAILIIEDGSNRVWNWEATISLFVLGIDCR